MEQTLWRHHNIRFSDPQTAEAVAIDELAPALSTAVDDGLIRQWWYMRKDTWRLRYLTDDPDCTTVPDLLDNLAADGRIVGWRHAIYEPETLAFGGEQGMDVAHELFHQDSRHVLAYLGTAGPTKLGRRETAVVLCTVMMRAAGLDWFEQGDVWAKVAALRPDVLAALPDEPASQQRLTQAVHRLMTVDPRPVHKDGGPLDGHELWVVAFERAGQVLAHLTAHGRLHRGLRAVLAHHVLFHLNRAGLPLPDQAAICQLALNNVFAEQVTSDPTMKGNRVTVTTDNRPELSADELRTELADKLRGQGTISTGAVEQAFRGVARHLFLPGVELEQAYADNPVYTKTDAAGAQISAASQPVIVARMLEQLAAQPGERIMEIGAGTGYNAALIGHNVGPDGHVTTIDVDTDLVEGAREHLHAAEASNVEVILGDGALGYPQNAPYDRIIATVGAYEIPTGWFDQLKPGGRLVVPVRLRGTASRSIVFERDGDAWRSNGSELCVFMPLRGIGDDSRRIVTVTEGVTLQVHKDQTVDAEALAGVLDTPRHELWTQVFFPPMVPFEWMDLWLACTLDNSIMRMNVKDAPAHVTPMFPWGAMATVQGSDLAYLALRKASEDQNLYEVGVVGHGPGGAELANQVMNQLRIWDTQFRTRAVRFEIPETPAVSDPAAGRFVLDRPHHPITVIWQ